MEVRCGEDLGAPAAGAGRQQVGVVDPSRQAVAADGKRRHQIEAQQGEVGEVVLGEGLSLEVGMDAAQAAQAAAAEAEGGEVGDDDLAVVADDDVDDGPLAVDDHPELAAQLEGALAQVAGQFRSDQLIGGDAPAVDPLQGLELARLEAGEIAVQGSGGHDSNEKGPARGPFFQARRWGRHIRPKPRR